jgi:dolichyl-phosphate-mannose-protein mannosyltransferase
MARQLFLHHYLPALYFAILTLSAVFDYLTSRVKPRTRLTAAFVILLLAVYVFRHFSPLSYGNPWTKKECMDSKWLKTWDFSW